VDLGADFLIIGSGIAALRAAAGLAGSGDVLILTKAAPEEGSTGYAQGGIAAAVGADDSPERHAIDTIAAGDGLCDEVAVRILVEEGARYVSELMAWGARFDRDDQGRVDLAREGAHSVRRVLHARDATGREIGRALWERVSAPGAIRVLDHTLACDLIVEGGRCRGATFLDARGAAGVARADATLVATGGAGQVFRETTNPPVATGDGIAMAYRAGARISDLEFVQFHPTALSVDGAPRFLLSEALRGEGARLVNQAGEAFMARYDPAAELAPRDRVARGIVQETERTGGQVYLTLSDLSADYVHRRFPLISAACRRAGFDLATDRIPVGPAVHYVMGGIETDYDGRTSIPALFAAGEVACTGVHGANRLASNSLLEGLVFGARAGQAMGRWRREGDWPRATTPEGERSASNVDRGTSPAERRPSNVERVDAVAVRDLMWNAVGLFRDGATLARAVRELDARWQAIAPVLDAGAATDREWIRAANIVTVGRLMARAALRREESRGAHYRLDFPSRHDAAWKRHLTESRFETDATRGIRAPATRYERGAGDPASEP